MPQQPPKAWKQAIFRTLASVERALRGLSPATEADLLSIRNFLFLQYESPLGSVVHATPVYAAIQHAMPNAHITVAASGMADSVLGNNPSIDRCVITPDPFKTFPAALRAVRKLYKQLPPGPVCIVTTIGNQRTRLALLSLLAGKATRVGYTLAPQLYDLPLRFHPEQGQIGGNLNILRRMGRNVPSCEPQIFFTAADAGYAASLLEAAGAPDSPRIAFVTRNSGGQPNSWSPDTRSEDRFLEVIAELSRTTGAVPVFLGTQADSPAIEMLRQASAIKGISVAGKTTVPQLAAVLAQCDLAISLDTGAFHVARAVGLPAVVIAPAWQSPLEWLPVGQPRYRVLRGPSIPAPTPGYWIHEISAREVADAALDLLRNCPPGADARAARRHRSQTGPAA